MDLSWLMDIFFPAECLNCRKKLGVNAALCASCESGIVRYHTLFCAVCGARLPALRKICHPTAPYILGAAGSYRNEPMKAVIHGLKFRRVKIAADLLANILADYITALGLPIERLVILPLPLSRRREDERGFNQSALIAKRLAARLAVPYEDAALVRIVHQKPQSETASAKERKENIKGCFAVKNGSGVAKKTILLVDDVTTSGATFREAAETLKAAGAKTIIALAAARA